MKTEKFDNIENLKSTPLRFYTEPDTTWWIENRQTKFENTNAYMLKKASQILKSKNWDKLELIETKNK